MSGAFVAVVIVGGVLLVAYDRINFSRNATQRGFLAAYVPEAECDAASFDVMHREDTIQDWGYVVRISGSRRCMQSLRAALAHRQAKMSEASSAIQGYMLPGHEDSEKELVAFDFDSEPGAVIWTRDKT